MSEQQIRQCPKNSNQSTLKIIIAKIVVLERTVIFNRDRGISYKIQGITIITSMHSSCRVKSHNYKRGDSNQINHIPLN